jgi:Holliday junction resolvase RusA-like endonuclease
MKFSVPLLPPSVNHYKQPKRGGGWYRAAEAIAFADAVSVFSLRQMVTGNFYEVSLTFHLGPKKQKLSSNDLDNFLKVALDSIAVAGVIVNDGRVLDLYVHKRFVATGREERTDFEVVGRQLDEGEVFRGRTLQTSAG